MPSVPHAIFINIAATGHMNPTLPLAKELCHRGAKVTYFVPESMRSVVEAAGASWKAVEDLLDPHRELLEEEFGLSADAPDEDIAFPKNILPVAAKFLPRLIADLKSLLPTPSVIIYDPFMPQALIAARVLGIPAVGMVTMPGPGVLAKPAPLIEGWEASPLVQKAREQILGTYGYDALEHGLLMEFYSPELNLVTTVKDLFAPPRSDLQIQRFGHFKSWRCVGPLMDLSVKRIAHVSAKEDARALPWNEIDAEVKAGKRLLYISMGTVANSFYYDKVFGCQGRSNGTAELTGKAFLQHVFGKIFEALGTEKQLLVLMATGPQGDVLEGLPEAPKNFILRQTMPQLEVLSKCHGFITHGGANSMHEALGFGVPMAVVPVFGDQPTNADSVASFGAGFSFCQPLVSLTVDAVNKAVTAILDPDASNSYRSAAGVMMQHMKEAGGVAAAADVIEDAVAEKARKLGGA